MHGGNLIPSDPAASAQYRRQPFETNFNREPLSLPTGEFSSLADYWRILVKRRWTVLSTAAVTLVIGTIVTLRTVPVYEAVTRVAVTREAPDPLPNQGRSGGSSDEDLDYAVALETHVRVLQADALALQVIHNLQLDKNARFRRQPAAAGSKPFPDVDSKRETGTLGAFKAGLRVQAVPNTRLLDIRYASPDPKLAAEIANALANAYIEQNIRGRYEATLQASEFLSRQLTELRIKMESSQQKLVEYQKAHEILGLDDKQNITTQKLDELNRALTQAQAERIQKETVFQLVKAGEADAIGSVAQNNTVQMLRAQEADAKRQLAQLLVQFGPSYPKVGEVQARLKSVQESLQAEINKAASVVRADYLSAQHREKLLRGALENQKREANQLNESAIEYNVLKRDADTNRQLYENLLQRLKEATLASGLRSSNLSVVDPARVPIVPSRPNIPRNLEIAAIFGLTLGIVLAFSMELLDSTLRTQHDIEEASGLRCVGFIPLYGSSASLARRNLKRIAARSMVRPGQSEIVAVVNPNSQATEAYRALRTSVLLSSPGSHFRTLLVTSALPLEGKTSTAVNMAVTLAQHNKRVLLVDADLRRPAVHRHFCIDGREGLADVLSGNKRSSEVVQQSEQCRDLFLLPAGAPARNPAELLGSSAMQEQLLQWMTEYNHIIIDSPPVVSVTDAVILSVFVDRVLVVVRSGVTERSALRRARELLFTVDARVLGVVLNGLDVNSPDSYYYGSKYRHYYENVERQAEAR